MSNPDGTVSTSEDAPQCAVPGCDNAAVPGSDQCGREDHAPFDNGDTLNDGTQGPTDMTGTHDGTGREQAVADLETAIRSIGDPDEAADALRQLFIERANELNAAHVLPPTWLSDGEEPEDRSDDNNTKTEDLDVEEQVELTDEGEQPEETETESGVPVQSLEGGDTVSTQTVEDAEAGEPAEPTASERAAHHARGQKRWKPRRRSAPDPRAEVRLRVSDLEVRSDSTDSEIILSGTPIVYSRSYDVHDMFGTFHETMAPSVCERVLASPMTLDCRYLFNHDGLPLARTQSGTLELQNTKAGLRSIAHLDPRQQLANDLAVAVERGDVSQMSCGFIVGEDEWDDDYMNRTIHSFSELLDVSPVTYPASPTTSVTLTQRSLFSVPTESRARIREAFKVMNEVRAGKVLSANNAQLILQALESLHAADDADPEEIATRLTSIAEAHGDALRSLQGVSGLETDDDTSVVEDPGEGVREDENPEEEQREADESAELRRQAVIARRNRLARHRLLR